MARKKAAKKAKKKQSGSDVKPDVKSDENRSLGFDDHVTNVDTFISKYLESWKVSAAGGIGILEAVKARWITNLVVYNVQNSAKIKHEISIKKDELEGKKK